MIVDKALYLFILIWLSCMLNAAIWLVYPIRVSAPFQFHHSTQPDERVKEATSHFCPE